jgi:hypothetical protein
VKNPVLRTIKHHRCKNVIPIIHCACVCNSRAIFVESFLQSSANLFLLFPSTLNCTISISDDILQNIICGHWDIEIKSVDGFAGNDPTEY